MIEDDVQGEAVPQDHDYQEVANGGPLQEGEAWTLEFHCDGGKSNNMLQYGEPDLQRFISPPDDDDKRQRR